MNVFFGYFRDLARAACEAWNRFWFSAADPATLGLVRILAGLMLFYTHCVWGLELQAFFGADAWVSPAAAASLLRGDSAWSYLWLVQSPWLLWTLHLVALAVFAMMAVGFCSRVATVLAFFIAVAYANRVPGALFGLDQINSLLAMYVMLGPCGAAYSVDRWLAARRAGKPLAPALPSVSANLALRLIQVHMCIIYFFAGLSKMQGVTWWDGSALWGAFANLEYQSIDMTWVAKWPLLVAAATQITVWWELSFAVIIWPRILRPLVLMVAIPLHLGIGICLGMMTFGLVMLIGCTAFVPPEWVRSLLDRKSGQGRAGEAAERRAEQSGDAPRRRPAAERPAAGQRR
ncbi:MAG TPA: HTTM domain-containing protein [Pirellulales bacterium]|nr:HTTM domain-containing protein [Pirellulales bacterium]